MPQGKGAVVRVIMQTEAVFRTAPAAAAKVIPHTSYGVKRDARRQQNATLNGSLLPTKTDPGDPIVGGPFSSILDLRSFGNWLKHAFGAATVGKAVTQQPTNVTGVTIHHASNDCTSGNGTLTFAIAGTTLTWAAQGGAAGPAINVGAGGNFTLESNGGGKSIRVSVIAAELPVGNQADANINVSAALKAHVFPFNVAALPSMLLEAQHSDLAKYYRTLGAKVGSLGWDVLQNDQNMTANIMAAVETVENAAFDANPTSYAAARACSGKGRISNGSSGLGTVVAGNVEVNNNLAGYECGDGLEGYGHIDEGEKIIGGSIRTVFDGASAYDLARQGTSTRLRLESGCRVGADDFKLVLDAPNVELFEDAPPKEGKSGLFVTNRWQLHYGTQAPELYLVNDVAAY